MRLEELWLVEEDGKRHGREGHDENQQCDGSHPFLRTRQRRCLIAQGGMKEGKTPSLTPGDVGS